MKMPEQIDPNLFAPCGMNCTACYKHCCHKKPCAGCRNSDDGKPEHCRKCKIKDCANTMGITYCFECTQFPCKLVRNLEKSYLARYHTSLIGNSAAVKEHGLQAFMKQQQKEYTCNSCGGIISIHDAECSECQAKLNR